MHKKTNQWLQGSNFFKKTGVLADNVVFVSAVNGPDGKGAAAARLGLSHFVDDKWEVLQSVFSDEAGNSGDLVRRFNGVLFHFASGGLGRWRPRPPHGTASELKSCYCAVQCWSEVLDRLRQDARGQGRQAGLQETKPGDAVALTRQTNVGIQQNVSFGVVERLTGPGNENFKFITRYSGGAHVYLHGRGSQDQSGLKQEPLDTLAVCISGRTLEIVDEASAMVEDLLGDIRLEYCEFAKAQGALLTTSGAR